MSNKEKGTFAVAAGLLGLASLLSPALAQAQVSTVSTECRSGTITLGNTVLLGGANLAGSPCA